MVRVVLCLDGWLDWRSNIAEIFIKIEVHLSHQFISVDIPPCLKYFIHIGFVIYCSEMDGQAGSSAPGYLNIRPGLQTC